MLGQQDALAQVKELATKTDNINYIPRAHMVETKSQLHTPNCPPNFTDSL